jgi:hypothetical protein
LIEYDITKRFGHLFQMKKPKRKREQMTTDEVEEGAAPAEEESEQETLRPVRCEVKFLR